LALLKRLLNICLNQQFCFRIGYKKCFCVIAVAVTFATSTLPLLPYIGTDTQLVKVCYGLLMAILYATFPGVYSLLAGAITDAFGPAHYQANFGLIFSITVAYFAVIVPMTRVSAYKLENDNNRVSDRGDLLWPWVHWHVFCWWSHRRGWDSCYGLYAYRFEEPEVYKIWRQLEIKYKHFWITLGTDKFMNKREISKKNLQIMSLVDNSTSFIFWILSIGNGRTL
jgi:hypothetical protein